MTELSRRLPPLATLAAFEAAARHGSFTLAADELALSQASISRRVRELEDFLGVRLFDRRRYDVAVTKEGDAFAAVVRAALRDVAAATDRLRDLGAGLNRLTVFTDIGLAQAIVVPSLGEFQRQHPNLQIRLLSSSEAIETIREEFDIGLQYGRRAENRFAITAIADEALFPVCSPELAARLPAKATPVDVAKLPLLHFSETGRTWPDWRTFLASFRLKEPRPIEGLTFSSYQICLDVAEKGEGVALGWSRTVKPRLDAGRLVRISEMMMPLPNAINLYRRATATANPIADRFAELLQSRIEPIT